MEESDNQVNFNKDNIAVNVNGFVGNINIPKPKIKCYLSLPWLTLSGAIDENITFLITDNVKWYTILMFKLLGCKITYPTTNEDKKQTIPLRQKIYNAINKFLVKVLKPNETK